MDRLNYTVEFEEYTARHYIKSFEKKYSSKTWENTAEAITASCERIDNLRAAGRIAVIKENKDFAICKLDFAIVGTRVSPRASGNRCIILEDKVNKIARVLLVYSKNDVRGNNETQWWRQEVCEAYPDWAEKF